MVSLRYISGWSRHSKTVCRVVYTRKRGTAARKPSIVSVFGNSIKSVLIPLLLAGAAVAYVAQEAPSTSSVRSQIIPLLTRTIDWYRQTQQEQHLATEPSDLTFMADNRRIADQIVRLAFDFARQEEQRLANQSNANEALNPSGALSEYESLVQTSAQTDQLVQQTQGDVASLKQRLEKAPLIQRSRIAAQLSETQSELALFQARQQGLHSMLDFLNEASTATGTIGLRSQIEELARSVPIVLTSVGGSESTPPSNQQPSPVANVINKIPSANMWALVGELFQLSSKRRTLVNEMRATETLEQNSKQLRSPLISRFRQLIETGNQLAKQADTSNQQGLVQERQQLDALTIEYKQLSATLTPLGKQAILLDLYKRNLSNWQADVSGEFKDKVKSLLVRLAGLLIVLGVVFIIGEIWRKAIFRYVHDPRRRYQFLLIRRIVLWTVAAIVLIFAFVAELGAVATFAGLITAGVAFALQSVIVSIVGYFFLIGKFGIRVGDRVQAGSVNGEVVEIGLVRFHLMELSTAGADAVPTGRVVAFSNSVVFQSTSALFKQIPGTNFIWHEISLKFAPEIDYRVLRARLDEATNTALASYRDLLERQRIQMEMTLSSIAETELKPRVRIHFTTSALEVVVRFPVVFEKAGEIDEQVISELFAAVDREPKLKLINSTMPAVKTEA
jgi:small-conductance mechanosensitive channel